MKSQIKLAEDRNTPFTLLRTNNIIKFGLFQSKFVNSKVPNHFELNSTIPNCNYSFRAHSPSKEYYINSFKKYYINKIEMKKKQSSKIEINSKKSQFKQWNTLEDIDFLSSSSINSNNCKLFKSASNAFLDIKVENSYVKLDKKNEEEKDNKIDKENCLTSPIYTHEEENYENILRGNNTRDKNKILSISVDLLMKKIAYEQTGEFNFDIIQYFVRQYLVFMESNILLDKIKNLFNFYTKIKMFPRGIIILLNKLIIYNSESLKYENLVELKEFFRKIKNYPEALEPELKIKEVLNHLNLLITNSLTNTKTGLYQNFIEKLNKVKNPIIPELSSKYFDVIDWSELEIAKQLTLFTYFLFMKIEMKELLSSNWTKENKYTLSPNVLKMIQRFNNLCNWVCEEILSYDCKVNRARAISKFIKIASFCQSINNFNDCVNIIAALNTLQIKSLKKTWSIVLKNSEIVNLFKELNSLCSYTKNYENIRNEISLVKGQSCIPYLGLYLKELAFIEEGPKYINDKQMINLEKIERVGAKLEELKEFQSYPFIHLPVTRLAFLADPKPKKEETLLIISSKLEPSFTLHSTKSLKKRPTNTDLTSIELNEVFKEMIREFSKENLINF